MYNHREKAWSFKTARFTVTLYIEPIHGYVYDGASKRKTQAKLDAGDFVAFDSEVSVTVAGVEVGQSSLGASVYGAGEVSDFWTAHRDKDPMQRNCSIMRAQLPYTIGYYFPDMVREAIREARKTLASMPHLRQAA